MNWTTTTNESEMSTKRNMVSVHRPRKSLSILVCCLRAAAASAIQDNARTSVNVRNSEAKVNRFRLQERLASNALSISHRQEPPPANLYLDSHERTSFAAVTLVAAANLLFNIIRPDPNISLQMKIPRVIWEGTIMILATIATHTTMPAVYLLLACVLGWTAIVDLFLWTPIFAFFSHFQSARLLVVVQCIVSGLFYLLSAITAMGCFTTIREEQKLRRQIRAMQLWDEQAAASHRP